MTTIIHCADVHLTAHARDRGYCLGVLDEIVELALRQRAEILLICGDLFDSFDDAVALRGQLREALARLGTTCAAIFVPGNHDSLGKGAGELSHLDFGALRALYRMPFDLQRLGDIELLSIPHQSSYNDYQHWAIAAKHTPVRIALVHALVCDMEIFAGPEAQEAQQPGVLDADLFARFQIDYAALGHIHSRRSKNFGAAQLHYPGSARVWRRGEAGPRGVNVLTVNGSSIQVEFAPLAAAGEYRLYRLPVTLDGSLDEVDQLIASWRPADWVEIQLSGIVEDENAVAALQHRIESAAGSRTRILNIDRSAVAPLPGILSQPLARAFIDEWKRREPADERDRAIWLKARETGLEQIRVLLEARPC